MKRRSGFVTACVLTLGLGIGASTTAFSVLNAVVLRPMPYGDAASLVYVWAPHRLLPDLPVNTLGPSQADFADLERDTRSISAMAYFDVETFAVTSGGVTDRVAGVRVSPQFFSTLQVSAAQGRTLAPGDDQAGHSDVAVISHRLWQRAFAASESAMGRSLTINRRPHRIVGVMPPAFLYPRAEDLIAGDVEGDATDIWLPKVLTEGQRASREFGDNVTIARLAPGVSLGTAQLELTDLMARLDRTRVPEMQGWSVALRSLVESSIGDARAPMWMLFGAVGLVLLIACSNVAHLLLARAGGRAREMAVRAALGASRWQLTHRVLGESMALSLGGGLLGVLITYGAIRALVSLNPGNIPRLAEASADDRVLVFAVALSALTGLILGLVPARWAAGADAGDILLRAQPGHTAVAGRRLRSSLIVAEVALAMVLISGAGLLLRSYAAVQRVEPGFSRSAVMLAVYLDDRYGSAEAQQRFFTSLLDSARRIPGVDAAGLVDALPLSQTQRMSRFEVDGVANETGQFVHSRMVTPQYFDAIGTAVISGRVFRDSDASGTSTPMLVNQAFANRYFPAREVIGRRMRFLGDDNARDPWSTIVGIVADVRHSSIDEAAVPQVYSPWSGIADRGYLVLRSPFQASAVIASVRSAARALDPMLPLDRLGSMSDLVGAATARRRFQTSVMAALAAGALLLAAMGLYGLLMHAVQQRMTEIGVRIALGAQARDIIRLVVGQGIWLTSLGLVIGGLVAASLTRIVQTWLFQVSAGDGLTFGFSGASLLAAALIAGYLPARRATRADVVKVLRSE